MSEVYWGVYEQGVLMSERLAKPDEVDTLSDEFIGVGTGWGAYTNAKDIPCTTLTHMRTPVNAPGPLV
jgi:tRNA A37 threonylcarbamoyladenosine modification protein TsaB